MEVTGAGWGAGCSLVSKDPVVQGGELTGAWKMAEMSAMEQKSLGED